MVTIDKKMLAELSAEMEKSLHLLTRGIYKAAGQEFKSVRGSFKFNRNNMPIQNFYAFQAVKVDSRVEMKQLGIPLANHMDAYYTSCALK